MARKRLTDEQITALRQAGWRYDEGWWFPPQDTNRPVAYGHTPAEAWRAYMRACELQLHEKTDDQPNQGG